MANASKHKWLHALKLQPAAQMAPQALNARPADTTDCPYLSKKRAREAEPEASASQVCCVSDALVCLDMCMQVWAPCYVSRLEVREKVILYILKIDVRSKQL